MMQMKLCAKFVIICIFLSKPILKTSLAVQGLRCSIPMQGVQFPSMIRELRSLMLHGAAIYE